jgi:hypothetical protein
MTEQTDLEPRIAEWRAAVLRGQAIDAADADELESHLRDQITELEGVGLSPDEAFLIGIRRIGEMDAVAAEYAREHSDRLWKQHAVVRPADTETRSFWPMLVLAAVAVVLIQVARLLAEAPGGYPTAFFGDPIAPWFGRNLGIILLAPLVTYFVVRRRMLWPRILLVAAIVAALLVVINVYPYTADSASELIVALHAPVVMWFVVGIAYTSGEMGSARRRMEFLRFSGEWAIYLTLIVLGGGVFVGLLSVVLGGIAPESIDEVMTWVLPSGGAAGIVVAAWLVEAKKGIIENLAPVLTAIFTPLFAAMLLAVAGVYLVLGIGREFDRELLGGFDALLIVVVALVVYGISARRDPGPARLLDLLRLAAVVAAIVLDLIVLVAMLLRVGDLGFTPNRAAALGLNIVLLGNLAGAGWFLGRAIATKGGSAPVERWQTGYLPVFALWVSLVVVALPPLFSWG